MTELDKPSVVEGILTRLLDIRRRRHWSQAEIAAHLGLTEEAYRALEKGRTIRLEWYTIVRLLGILDNSGLSVNWFFGRTAEVSGGLLEARPMAEPDAATMAANAAAYARLYGNVDRVTAQMLLAQREMSAGAVPGQVPQQLPPQVPAQLPPQVPAQLPPQVPAQLPPQVPAQLPPQVPAQLPPQMLPPMAPAYAHPALGGVPMGLPPGYAAMLPARPPLPDPIYKQPRPRKKRIPRPSEPALPVLDPEQIVALLQPTGELDLSTVGESAPRIRLQPTPPEGSVAVRMRGSRLPTGYLDGDVLVCEPGVPAADTPGLLILGSREALLATWRSEPTGRWRVTPLDRALPMRLLAPEEVLATYRVTSKVSAAQLTPSPQS